LIPEDIPMTAEQAFGIDLHGERLTSAIFRLAVPLVGERISQTVISIISALLVGRFVGSDGLAAVGIAGLLFWLPLSGAWGVSIGGTVLTAHDTGARASEDLRRAIHATVTSAFTWGLVTTLLFVAAAQPLMQLMAAEGDVLSMGVDYIRISAVGIPFMALMFAVNGCLRGMGDTRTPMLIIVVCDVISAVLAVALISGAGGLPEMGAVGAGLAYTGGGIAGGLLAISVLALRRGPIRFEPFRAFAFRGRDLRRLLNIAIPAGLEELQFSLAFLVYSRIITGLGTAATAAHTVSLRVLEIAMVPGFALGTAGTAIVGQSLGAGLPALAERAGREVQKWAVLTMVVLGIVTALTAPWIVSAFVDDQEVVDVGTACLRVFALAFPMMGTGVALSGALRGAGDVRYVLAVITFSAWAVRIPFAFLFSHVIPWGAPGAWLGAVMEHNVRGGLVWLRFRGGRWKTKRL